MSSYVAILLFLLGKRVNFPIFPQKHVHIISWKKWTSSNQKSLALGIHYLTSRDRSLESDRYGSCAPSAIVGDTFRGACTAYQAHKKRNSQGIYFGVRIYGYESNIQCARPIIHCHMKLFWPIANTERLWRWEVSLEQQKMLLPNSDLRKRVPYITNIVSG